MTDQEVYQGLTDIFRDIFDDASLELGPTTSAADIPEWTSFIHIQIIVAAETRFGVKFTTSQVEHLKNVGNLVALIQEVRSKRR